MDRNLTGMGSGAISAERSCVSPRDPPPLPDWRFHTPRALMTKQLIQPLTTSWLPALTGPLSRSTTSRRPRLAWEIPSAPSSDRGACRRPSWWCGRKAKWVAIERQPSTFKQMQTRVLMRLSHAPDRTRRRWVSFVPFSGLAVLSVSRQVPTFGNAYKFDARFHLLQFPVFSGAGSTAPGPTCQGPPADLGPVRPLSRRRDEPVSPSTGWPGGTRCATCSYALPAVALGRASFGPVHLGDWLNTLAPTPTPWSSNRGLHLEAPAGIGMGAGASDHSQHASDANQPRHGLSQQQQPSPRSRGYLCNSGGLVLQRRTGWLPSSSPPVRRRPLLRRYLEAL